MADSKKGAVPRKIEKAVGVFGHSFVAGYHDYYTEKLNEFCPGLKFESHGIKSTGAAYVVGELEKIFWGEYDEAIIHTGINEIASWNKRTWKGKFKELGERLHKAIKIAREKGIGRIILVEATPWKGYPRWTAEKAEYTLEYNKFLARLAKDKDVELVKLYDLMEGEEGALKKEYSGDSLHPNKKGYEVIAKAIAQSKYPQWIELKGYVPLRDEPAKGVPKSAKIPAERETPVGNERKRRRIVH